MINHLKVLISYRKHMLGLKWYSLTPMDTVPTQARTHALSLALVIYWLLLSGQHRKIPVAQSHVICDIFCFTTLLAIFDILHYFLLYWIYILHSFQGSHTQNVIYAKCTFSCLLFSMRYRFNQDRYRSKQCTSPRANTLEGCHMGHTHTHIYTQTHTHTHMRGCRNQAM